jgi:quercetin dioxygenase-like cupin family protein
MYFNDSKTRPTKQLVPGVLARTFWGEKMLMALVDLAPHAIIPPHSHPYEQIGMALEGTCAFTIADETRQVQAGDVWVIPSGVTHSVVMGDAPGVVVEFFSPARDDYKY